MSKLFITTFQGMGKDKDGGTVGPSLAGAETEALEIEMGKTSQTKPFAANVRGIELYALEHCSIAVGPEAIANPRKGFLPAKETRHYSVAAGQILSVTLSEDF